MIKVRALTDLEKQFIEEAEKGGFLPGLMEDGSPFAYGAENTGDLFSMETESAPDQDDWIYFLPGNERLSSFLD